MRLLLPPASSPFSASQPTPTAPAATPILLSHLLMYDLKALQISRTRCDDAALLHPACASDPRSRESPYEELARVCSLNAL